MLDPVKLAEGIGELVEGKSGPRIVVAGKTLAYVKRRMVTVPAALIKGAPKKLVGDVHVEKNGRWAGVEVADNDAARAVLEWCAGQQNGDK